MTTPPPEDDPGPGRPAPGAGGGEAAGRGELPADLREFLVRLGKAVQRHGLYPRDHPALEPIVQDLLEGLDWVLSSRERISVGVSPESLVHEDGESDPDHPVLSSLADRLHAHHVSRLTFRPGLGHDELSEFLGEAARTPESSEEALGIRREVTEAWPHVVVEPVHYEGLAMVEETMATDEADMEFEGESEDLWLGLARSALAEEAMEELEASETPSMETMVAALSEVTADRARARAVAARMVALAQMLDRAGEEDSARVRDRFIELVHQLGPRTVGKLLDAAPQEQRQAFLRATVDWLPAGTVVELLEEVADSRSLDVSYQMLRLVSRLADYSELDTDALDPEAGVAFRDQVKQLVSGWRANIAGGEGPEAGQAAPRSSGPGTSVLPEQRISVDPGRVVRTALEAGALGPVGREAIEEMLDESRAGELLELLREPPEGDGVVEEAWSHVDISAAVRELLARSPPDFGAVDALLERRGDLAAGPLLDVLSESESRSVRRQLFSRLAALKGADVTDAILERVDDDRWFVQRNMLALLVERDGSPEGFTALPYTRHPRPEVRQEAYKLTFRSQDRAEAVRRALDDDDQRARGLGLGALQEMPEETVDEFVPRLRRLASGDVSPDLAGQAVRALARSRSEEALDALLDLCRTRKMWRFWTVDLAEKSPVLLEALRVLARRWHDRPEADRLLARARGADDPEIREAARPDPEAA